jgi:hypothetical protein
VRAHTSSAKSVHMREVGFRAAAFSFQIGRTRSDRRQSNGLAEPRKRIMGEDAMADVPLLLLSSPFHCVCELLDFMVRGISRHEARYRLTIGEAADERRTTGDGGANDLAELAQLLD